MGPSRLGGQSASGLTQPAAEWERRSGSRRIEAGRRVFLATEPAGGKPPSNTEYGVRNEVIRSDGPRLEAHWVCPLPVAADVRRRNSTSPTAATLHHERRENHEEPGNRIIKASKRPTAYPPVRRVGTLSTASHFSTYSFVPILCLLIFSTHASSLPFLFRSSPLFRPPRFRLGDFLTHSRAWDTLGQSKRHFLSQNVRMSQTITIHSVSQSPCVPTRDTPRPDHGLRTFRLKKYSASRSSKQISFQRRLCRTSRGA